MPIFVFCLTCKRLAFPLTCFLACFLTLTIGANTARGEDSARELLIKSEIVLENMLNDPDYPKLRELLRTAKGVLIFPSLLKGGFFLGGEGGNGVLLTRNAEGRWSGPAFFTLGSVSFGLQFGFEETETIFTIITERGIDSVIGEKVKLGVDASVATGPVGIGASASMTAKLADLYSFSRAQGAFLGVSFEGAYIHPRNDLNKTLYGREATARQILVERVFDNPSADPLRAILNRLPSLPNEMEIPKNPASSPEPSASQPFGNTP